MSQFEGQQLLELLERLVADDGAGLDAAALRAVEEKLSDAQCLAVWLREDVALELQPTEAARVMETLGIALQQAPSPEARAALAAARDRFCAQVHDHGS